MEFVPSNLTSNAPVLRLSVVVPCFNEEECLRETYSRLKRVCEEMNPPLADSYEIIFVNDGSSDRTWSLLQELAQSDPSIVAVNLSRNHGHQLALTAGLSLVRGERVLIIDADLQDPPELLQSMWREMDQGFDVVYGQRISRESESLFKLGTAHSFYRLINLLSDVEIPRDTGDFRLIKRKVVRRFLEMPESHRFVRGMIAWLGFRQKAFPYERKGRFAGTTKYPLSRMLKLAADAITGFSVKPLRFALYMALFGVATAFFLSVYVFWSYLSHNVVQGWASLSLILIFFSTAQLLSLAILGEYLGRVFVQVKGRPLFLIDEVVTRHVTPSPQGPAELQ